MYLLDTNVGSEMRKARLRKAHPGVQRWVDASKPEDHYLSTITLFELETGILRKQRKDVAQAEVYRRWLHEQVLPRFAGRILSVDDTVALRCAELHVPVTVAIRDSLIAATALVHRLTVVTRNEKDFVPMGVRVLNPWSSAPTVGGG